MNATHLVLHGLAIKKHAGAGDIAGLVGLKTDRVQTLLEAAAQSGRAVKADARFLVSPLGKVALESSYSRYFAVMRQDQPFIAAYDSFERINVQLKALITDWQTVEMGGRRVANDHGDKDHDARIIDRLGDLHERANAILAVLERGVSRLGYYRKHLLSALEKAEDGAIEWVSDVRIESYHTLWFELHEDLLRIVGATREE